MSTVRAKQAALVVSLLAGLCPSASALNPSLDVNQYAHTAWTVGEGFFKHMITSIAQTPDGYLWLGTKFGLLRFDGVRSVPWQPPLGERLPDNFIRSLLAAHDGRLWIGTAQGLVSWKDGKLAHYLQQTDVSDLLEDGEGTVWAGGTANGRGRLCAIRTGSTQCHGEDGSLDGGAPSLYEDSQGNLWAANTNGLWRWKPGPPKLYPMPAISGFAEGDNGELLVAMMSGGLRHLVNGRAEAYSPQNTSWSLRPYRLLRDRNGGLWIGTMDRGLVHVHQGRTDLYGQSDGLAADFIIAFLEDREGNIWVVTPNGLDRFRDFAMPTISSKQGLSDATVRSVLSARDGSVWLGSVAGLDRWSEGHITTYRKTDGIPDDIGSLFQDDRGRIWVSTRRGVAYFENDRFVSVPAVPVGPVPHMGGDRTGNLWIAHKRGLFHLLGGSVVERIPWATLGLTVGELRSLLADQMRGGVWLGLLGGGLVYLKDGQVRQSYAAADGLGEGSINDLQQDEEGTIWAATEAGLSRVKNGRVATLGSNNGLPCDTTDSALEDDDHALWLYTPCGLVRITRTELNAWATDPKRTIQVTAFDSSDGIAGRLFTSAYRPRAAKSTNGTLWFLSGNGVTVIDPRHLPVNRIPPPVHIEQIIADGKVRWQNLSGAAASNLRQPALTRDLQIDYTALSFVAPEKNRFRIKLEGRDRDWQDVGTRRQAFYNDLPPGSYRFRVIASNNSGVWNETGATLDFSIAPAYYQTWWFEALVAVGTMLLLWVAYQARMLQVALQFQRTFDARVSERTRIARDLHDTMLQSFQGTLLLFQSARNVITSRPDEAAERLDRALDQAAAAITEGRNAVQGLRASATTQNDLANGIAAIGAELTSDPTVVAPAISVDVEGPSRNLNPLVRDEACRIAAEALRNAVKHARARRVTVTILYEPRQLRLTVHDDGQGIPAETLAGQHVKGHFGVPGMRERAAVVNGQLEILSAPGAGTEIELRVPAAIAYGTAARRSRWRRG